MFKYILFKALAVISLLTLIAQNTVAYVPFAVTIKPDTITDALAARCLNINPEINLANLSPEVLEALSPIQLKEMLRLLEKHQVKIRWKDRYGIVRSGRLPVKLQKHIPVDFYDKSTAAAGITLIMFTKTHNTNLIARMIAAAPKEILLGLRGNAYSILSPYIVSTALLLMLQDVCISVRQPANADSATIIQDMGTLISFYLKYWAKTDPRRTQYYAQGIIDLMRSTELSPEHAGILCGAILGGTIRLATDIMEGDVRKVIIAIMIGNLISVITNLVAIVGVVSPAAPFVVPATIIPVILGSIAVLVPGIFALRKNSIRDYRGIAREIIGGIEMSLLQGITTENRSAIMKTLAWMRTAVHLNSCCY